MKTLKVLMCASLLALPLSSANADSRTVKAHCFDFRTNKVTTYTGTRDTIKELTDYGQVRIKLPGRSIYFPLHQCITEFYE